MKREFVKADIEVLGFEKTAGGNCAYWNNNGKGTPIDSIPGCWVYGTKKSFGNCSANENGRAICPNNSSNPS